MRIIIVGVIIGASLLSLGTQAQTQQECALPDSVKYGPKLLIRDAPLHNIENPRVLFMVDNKVVPFDSIQNLNTKRVKSLHVYKPTEAVALYGQRAKDGAVVIVLKKLPRKRIQK